MPEKDNNDLQSEKTKKSTRLLVSILILALITSGFVYYKLVFPGQLMNYGKKYVEIKQFDKALKIFRYLGNLKPQDIEPIYYEVYTLAKMPPTYENQKRLYEISQYDDCDKASALADDVLANIRMQIDRQAGTNYIDNVLFDDMLVRWNNTHPITYSIIDAARMPNNISDLTDKAFARWQSATNGEFKFRKKLDSSNIIIHIVYALPKETLYTEQEPTAVTVASISGDKLNQMDIYIKSLDNRGNPYPDDKLYALLLHEIGHALGLGGHSAMQTDVMYHDGDYISDYMLQKDISRRDLNTLNLLYKMVPDAIDINLADSIKNNLLYHEIITTYPGENFEIETQRLIQELKRDKKNVEKWVNLATNYAIKHQYPRSNYILERIIPIVSTDKDNLFAIYYNMALNYYRMKDYALSAKYLGIAESIKTDAETQTLSAFIDIKEGRLNEAKEKLIQLKKSNPDDIEVAIKLAEIYHRENNIKDRKKTVQDVIKANPAASRDKRLMKYS